ncbi:hypothetical protein RF11_15895 [Thelohanellus kitauei]|uniref:Uncharacterized protein n=1 Tax=Thelohanellus kitauei TaxID=669202 RepID=A0A0C2LZY6_THEKT|nr:hypothetical protein RF11_15895 [Thelohanellus kitauei]
MVKVSTVLLFMANIGFSIGWKTIDIEYRSADFQEFSLFKRVCDRLLNGLLQIPDQHTGKFRNLTEYETSLLTRDNVTMVKSLSSSAIHLMFEVNIILRKSSPANYWSLFTLRCWNECPYASLYVEVTADEAPEPQIKVIYFRNRPKPGLEI